MPGKSKSIDIVKTFPTGYKHPSIDYTIYIDGMKEGHLLSHWPSNTTEPVHLHVINVDDPGKRGKGIGSILMQAFLDDVDKTNRNGVILHVEGRGASEDAFIDHAERNVKFYDRFGFKVIDPSWKKEFSWSGPWMARIVRRCT